MKKPTKIYLEPEDLKSLEQKARALGFTGRGGLSRFAEKLAREEIIFLDRNSKALLRALDLK